MIKFKISKNICFSRPAPPFIGRDENVSKMDVDSVDRRRPVDNGLQTHTHTHTHTHTSEKERPQSGQRRPVEKLSLVDADHENLSLVDVDQ